MPKKAPRPKLRTGVGESAAGRSGEMMGAPLNMVDYDIPFTLGGAGQMQWLQWSMDPLPWWTDADLPTLAQYCAMLDAAEASRGGSANGSAVAHRELRALGDALGLTPMARARMGLKKAPSSGGGPRSVDPADNEGPPAPVIPIDDLIDDRVT